jgi:hypothetical protein
MYYVCMFEYQQSKDDQSSRICMIIRFSNWDSVGMLRELMETRDVKKMPGSSWIEIEKNPSLLPTFGGFM